MNKISLNLTYQDLYDAQWVHYNLGALKFILIGCLATLFCYVLIEYIGISIAGSVGAVLGWLIWYFSYYLIYLRHRCKKIFQQQVNLKLPAEIEWDSEGVKAINEKGSNNLRWSDYLKWRENKRMFLLYQSDLIFNIIPKSAFIRDSQLVEFRENLNKIGR